MLSSRFMPATPAATKRSHGFFHALFVTIAFFTVGIDWQGHRRGKARRHLDKQIAAYRLAVGITQRRGDAAAGALDRLEAQLLKQQRAQDIVGAGHDEYLRRAD